MRLAFVPGGYGSPRVQNRLAVDRTLGGSHGVRLRLL